MTRERLGVAGEGSVFSSPTEARIAYDHGAAHMQAKVRVRLKNGLVDTTVGRILVGELLPDVIPYSLGDKFPEIAKPIPIIL